MAKKKTNMGLKIGVGALAAVGVGYYFYASNNAKKHRKIAAKWAAGLKNDVMKRARVVKNLDRKGLAEIVDQAAQAYHKMRKIDKKDLVKAVGELKSNWNEIEKELGRVAAYSGKKAKLTIKKIVDKK